MIKAVSLAAILISTHSRRGLTVNASIKAKFALKAVNVQDGKTRERSGND